MKTDPYKLINASITISEVHCAGGEKDYVNIEIEDEDSGCRILTLELDHWSFARALFSHAFTECQKAELLRDLSRVGKKHEHKSEVVGIHMPKSVLSLNDTYHDHSNLIRKAVKPFEVDGWKARINDALNHHNHRFTDQTSADGSRTSHFLIGFDRWVDKES